MGTPLYMSPEQCRGSGKLDHRTDIYSLAVILFEMISGRPPFVAEGVGELFAKHMLEPAPSLTEFAPQAPPYIVRAVARALSKDLDDRFPNMKAFRDALNGQDTDEAPASADARPRRLAGQQPTTLQANRAGAIGGLPPEQTTLSSMVSEREGDIDGFPPHSRRGPLIGIAVAIVAVAAGFVVFRKGQAPPSPTAAISAPPRVESPVAPPPSSTPAPATVKVRFEAEPADAHVFRKVEGKTEAEDLGAVPLELNLTRSSETADYLLRADNHKERAISVTLSHDQVVHLALEREAPLEKDKRPKPAPARPARPKRPAIHDADGLAVPSF